MVRVLGAQAEVPIDRLEDATLVSAELLTLALAHRERVEVRLRRLDRGVEVAMDDPDGALARGIQAGGPSWSVIKSVADSATPETAEDQPWLVVRVVAAPAASDTA